MVFVEEGSVIFLFTIKLPVPCNSTNGPVQELVAPVEEAGAGGTPAALRAQEDDSENSRRADVTLVLTGTKY